MIIIFSEKCISHIIIQYQYLLNNMNAFIERVLRKKNKTNLMVVVLRLLIYYYIREVNSSMLDLQ